MRNTNDPTIEDISTVVLVVFELATVFEETVWAEKENEYCSKLL